jgi:hypothetical protein
VGVTLPLGRRRAQARRGARIAEDAVDEGLAVRAEAEAQRAAEIAARKTADRAAEAARVRLTRADVEGARFVRDSIGWHEVVRINAKSVTVRTPYSWNDLIPLGKVLEVRR